jgi:hypothetical protein
VPDASAKPRAYTPATSEHSEFERTRVTASGTTPSKRSVWARHASIKQLGGGLVAGAGVLTGVLTAANVGLHGLAFLMALTLGAVGVVLIVEAASREAAAHPFPLYVVGGGLLLLSLVVGFQPWHAALVRRSPLRVTFAPTAQALYNVAFRHDIGLPAPTVGWAALHARAGTDVHYSTFRFTFANRSGVPLLITDVHVQILGRVSPPTGSVAAVYTQGDEQLKGFHVQLDNPTPGSTAAFHRVRPAGQSFEATPFFQANDISLQPGELYQGTVTVETEVDTALRYRFVVLGQTPSASFSTSIPGVFEISGRLAYSWSSYDHYYWNLDECQERGGHPWIKVSTYPQWLSGAYAHGCPPGSTVQLSSG